MLPNGTCLDSDEDALRQLNEIMLLDLFSKKPIAIDDVIQEEASLDFMLLQLQPTLSLEEIENYYSEPATGDEIISEGTSLLQVINHAPYAIHLAARDGQCNEIESLFNQGYDINQKDLHSITPLHVAALFGQLSAVQTLIKLGAKVNATGYEDHTPLHFAMKKQHTDVANALIQAMADPLKSNYEGQNGFTMVCDALSTQFLSYEPAQETKLIKINQIFNLIDLMISQSQSTILYTESFELKGQKYVLPVPASLALECIASFAPSKELAEKTRLLANEIKGMDNAWQIFLNAKDLLHRFPTGKTYNIKLNSNEEILLPSEGHLGIFTTSLATDSVTHFIQSIEQEGDDLKLTIFNTLKHIYENANDFVQNSALAQTAQKAFELYNAGDTVLLPSGWKGHFIDVILSKNQACYVIANSGDRYHGEAPEYEPDPPGILFYKIQEPEKISPQFIHDILTNVDRMALEYEYAYQYGLIEKIDNIIKENQTFGNCGWESHRNAIEGLIYIELLNHNIAISDAKNLANLYYQEWDQFHGGFVIDNYMAMQPGLPFQAMLEIFTGIHLKEYYNEADHYHAQKIADAMLSSQYMHDFQDWLIKPEHDVQERLMMNILQEQHNIDVHPLPQENATHTDIMDSIQTPIIMPVIELDHPQALELLCF
ncbi:MAG: ankyrin repeat domain-containing protein [Proteobacteria bacterium]|nr:ankyrin repeat domain-containing protein [Pseudomonadota bacterium]